MLRSTYVWRCQAYGCRLKKGKICPHLTVIHQHPLQAEILNAMESTIVWLPTIPFPVPFDVQKRIQELRSYLDPNNPHYEPERQHINIKAAIKLYEDGKIDGVEHVHIMNGKIVSEEEMFKGPSCSWSEAIWHQFVQKHVSA
jgi:hypothetical protein